MLKSRFLSRTKSWTAIFLVVVILFSSMAAAVQVYAQGTEAEDGTTGVEGTLREEFEEATEDEILELFEQRAGVSTFAVEAQDVTKDVTWNKQEVYINGKLYTGDDVEITTGTSFSYEFAWQLSAEVIHNISQGDFFRKTFFSVKGLNLPARTTGSAIITNGNRRINIGTWTLTYDTTTGAYTYEMVFSQYASIFDGLSGFKTGSGKFNSEVTGGQIIIDDTEKGVLNVKKPESSTDSGITGAPDGVGWSMEKPPVLEQGDYPFGKGIKWSSQEDSDPSEIEWRAVYLNLLQKEQKELLEANTEQELSSINKDSMNASTDDYVIEDTLDENQQFYFNSKDKKYQNGAPFFFEIPIMTVGTKNYINGTGMGTGYDGNGDFTHYITGDEFEKITADCEDLGQLTPEEYVKANPWTWTVTKVEGEDGQWREKLIINVGMLGTTSESEGMVQGELHDHIMEAIVSRLEKAQTNIENLREGRNSPVDMLNEKTTDVKETLTNLGITSAEVTAAMTAFDNWYQKYFTDGNEGKKKSALSQEAISELKAIRLDEALAALEAEHPALTNHANYQDWKKQYTNLESSQAFYQDNLTAYLNGWKEAERRYRLTEAFYADGQVYGFVMKYRTEVINTSSGTYSNKIQLSAGREKLQAEDSADIKFAQGISGTYSLGSVVIKKADSGYGDSLSNVRKGLKGAVFNVYCAESGEAFVKDDDHLACFAERDASADGKSYVWSHNNKTDSGSEGTGILGAEAVTDLVTDADGTLALEGLKATTFHCHYLVEKEPPQGYYLNETPVKITTDDNKVEYQLLPNVARAVKLTKESSYDGKKVEGAEFALYKKEGATWQRVTGFEKDSITVPASDTKPAVTTQFYRYDRSKSEKLLTFPNGELNIHGLDPGDYYLEEINAADGYQSPAGVVKYNFTLAEKMTDELKLYDENHFRYVLANPSNDYKPLPVLNDEKTKDITITKVGRENQRLTGAVFSLLRWKGTPQQWADDPNNREYWETVTVNASDSVYFKTTAEKSDIPDGYFVEKDGTLTFTDIPNGHYALLELVAPDGYQRADNLWHFDVNVSNDRKVQLSWNANENNPIADNQIPNDLPPGSLKVHKVVVGNHEDLRKQFKFTIDLKSAADQPITSQLNYTLTEKDEATNTIVEVKSGVCTPTGGKYEVLLSHEQALTLTGLPAGTKYTVSEADYPEYDLVFIDDNGTGTIPSKGVATVTARNRYRTGLLRLTKNVTGPDADCNRLFDFHLKFQDVNGNPLTGIYKYMGTSNDADIVAPDDGAVTLVDGSADVRLKAGQQLTFFGLPNGMKYTITETPVETYTTKVSTNDYLVDDDGNIIGGGMEDTVVEGNEISGTVQDNRRDNVDFNNVRTPEDGALMIAKFVDSLQVMEDKKFLFHITATDKDGSPIIGEYNVEVRGTDHDTNEDVLEKTITFDSRGRADYELGHRDYLIINGLPEKANYEFVEESEEGYEISVGSASKGVIDEDEAAVGIVTNYQREGNLIISKEVLGRGGDVTRDFEFTVAFKNEAGEPLHGTYRYTGSSIDSAAPPKDGELELNDEGEALVSLKHGQRINVSGIPENSTYRVVETAVENYQTTVMDGEGTIHDKVVANARFVNRFRTGALRVSKTVDKGDKEKAFHFTITLGDTGITGMYDEMEFHNGVAELDLKDGEYALVTGLPAGVTYTVEESGNEGYNVIKTGDVGAIADEKVMRAEFINTKTDTGLPEPPTDPNNPEPPTDPNNQTPPDSGNQTPPPDSDNPNMPSDLNQTDNHNRLHGQTGTSGMEGAGMQTGDNSQAWKMFSVMVISLGVIVFLLNKKKNNMV